MARAVPVVIVLLVSLALLLRYYKPKRYDEIGYKSEKQLRDEHVKALEIECQIRDETGELLHKPGTLRIDNVFNSHVVSKPDFEVHEIRDWTSGVVSFRGTKRMPNGEIIAFNIPMSEEVYEVYSKNYRGSYTQDPGFG